VGFWNFQFLAPECNVERKNQNVMNGDGFHQKILGAPAGLAIPKQVRNMTQSLEFTFFFVRCPKVKKIWVRHGHLGGLFRWGFGMFNFWHFSAM